MRPAAQFAGDPVLFLDELPRWHHGAGIALILAGVAQSSWRVGR